MIHALNTFIEITLSSSESEEEVIKVCVKILLRSMFKNQSVIYILMLFIFVESS